MIFSYNWLQSFFKEKLPKPEKLAEILTMHSFEKGEIRKVGKDFVLDIDVLPNRAPDCLSHLGIARELAAIMELKFSRDVEKVNKPSEDKKLRAKDFVSLEVKPLQACPRYTARVIFDVKIGPSPQWIQDRLKVCGLRPINNIVDIANYVMLETGQPLHAFDSQKLEHPPGGRVPEIIVRFARKGEKIVTLDEEQYDLDENILVIADERSPVAIAGIKGGKIPEIDRKTKIVVIESANFNQRVIRRGSKKLDLKTNASWRFEHGIDPNLTEFAINRASYLIQEITGGIVTRGLIDFYPKKVLPKRIKLDLDYVEKLLGIKISKKEIKFILQRLSFKCNEARPRYITVTVPSWRLDISLAEDLIEEIGRIYGYQKIKAIFPIVSLIPPKRNLDIFWENFAKDLLKTAGFSEVYNYSFISEKDAVIFGYRTSAKKILTELVEVENPVSGEQKFLRPSLIPNLLKNVRENLKHFEQMKIFELGKAFQKYQISEKKMLTGLLTRKDLEDTGFYELKGVVDSFLNKLGISNIWYDSYQQTSEESKMEIWQSQKCAEIKVDNQEVGFLGAISSKVLEKLSITRPVVVFDFDFDKLSKLCSEEHEYQPISRFPAAVRDIAVLVPREVRVEEVLNKIEIAGGPLIRDVDLFDIYEGEELPEDSKNLAFHIIYQAEDKTLSSKEIDIIQKKIIKALEENPSWQVRR